MKPSIAITLCLLLGGTTAVLAKPEHAQGKNKQQKVKKEKQKHKKEQRASENSKFYETEKQTFRNYYKNLPPGLAKKLRRGGKLPKGWQNKVAAGQVLPREYYRMRQPVPKELRETVHVGPIGSEIIRIENKIFQLEKATHIIMDVFEL